LAQARDGAKGMLVEKTQLIVYSDFSIDLLAVEFSLWTSILLFRNGNGRMKHFTIYFPFFFARKKCQRGKIRRSFRNASQLN
jgi:hypothetical protein